MICGVGLACAAATSAPALAGYEEGMEAFSRGDYATAFEELRPLADRGDANAQFTLGFMYDYGQGVRRNAIEAIWWYRKAAEQGSAVAQFTLGGIYESGRGAPKDLIAAYRWYSLAAESLPPGEIRTTVIERQNKVAAQLSENELAHARELLLGQAAAADADAASAKPRRSGPDGPVDRDLLARIQAELARLGYHTGRTDGVMNESTRGAILAFEIESGRDPEGMPTEELLDALASVESTTLPLVTAGPGEETGPEATQPPEVASDLDNAAEEPEVADATSPEEVIETSLATADEPVVATPETATPSTTQEASIGTDDADSGAVVPEPADNPADNPSENARTEEQLAALDTGSETAAVPDEPSVQAPVDPPEPKPQPETDFVRAIQSELKRLGYDVGPIDGLAGRKTVTAIRSFEVAEHLPVTGVLSEELLAQLRETQPPQSQLSDDSASFEPAGETAQAAATERPADAVEDEAAAAAGTIADATRPEQTDTTLEAEQTTLNSVTASETPASDGTAVIEQTTAASDASGTSASVTELATASPAEQPSVDDSDSPIANGQAPRSIEPPPSESAPAAAAAQATTQTAIRGEADQTPPPAEEPFEAPALELRLTAPQLEPSQPPELDNSLARPETDERGPAAEAPTVGLQAPTPLVGQVEINGQATGGQATVPQPPDVEPTATATAQAASAPSPTALAPTPLVPEAPTPAAQPATAEPSVPQAAGLETTAEPAQQQTAALTNPPSPNESRNTEPGSTEPKPDLNAAAKRRVLNQQLARLGEIAAQVDSPSAAVPGWSKLEAWETETANVLSSRFGPKTANGLLAKRQELVLGDPFGNFKRATQAYRLYLNGLKKNL